MSRFVFAFGRCGVRRDLPFASLILKPPQIRALIPLQRLQLVRVLAPPGGTPCRSCACEGGHDGIQHLAALPPRHLSPVPVGGLSTSLRGRGTPKSPEATDYIYLKLPKK